MRYLLIALSVAATASIGSFDSDEHGEAATEPFKLSEQGAVDLKQKIAALPFNAKSFSLRKLQVEVGIYLLHLYGVNDQEHTFSSDFITVYRWKDTRNLTSLFEDDLYVQSNMACHKPGSIELHEDEMALIWQPDLHLSNAINDKSLQVHSKKMKIFAHEDGAHQIELVLFQIAELEMAMPGSGYHAYPFDEHFLPIKIESMSYSANTLRLTGLNESTVSMAHTHEWPGWRYVSHEVHSEIDHHELGEDACSLIGARKARVELVIRAARGTRGQWRRTFVPTGLLVLASLSGCWVSLNALMPRVAIAFVSYLTLTSWAGSHLASLPKVMYPVWLDVFMSAGKLFMLWCLFETIIAHAVAVNASARTALVMDKICRVMGPLMYAVVLAVLAANYETEAHVEFSENFLYVCSALVALIAITGAAIYHVWLRRILRDDPLGLYLRSLVPLDNNELDVIYDMYDVDRDHALDMAEIVDGILAGNNGRYAASLSQQEKTSIIAQLTEKFGPYQTREKFRANLKPIFSDLLHVLHFSVEAKERQTRSDPSKKPRSSDDINAINVTSIEIEQH